MRRLALLVSIALVAALAPSTAALARPAARASIVGGGAAAPGTWPFAAFVADLQGDMATVCTGTVVAPRVILTAAHCATDAAADNYRVITGALDWANGAGRQMSHVTQVETFPHWDPQGRFGDATLLILSTPTPAPAIPLATLDDVALLRPGVRTPLAGWGQTAIDDQDPPTLLRTGTVALQSVSYCGNSSAELQGAFQPAGMLCAIDSRDFSVGPCHGDSGGPLVATRADGTPVQIGITSAGEQRCSVRLPGFFTRVDLVSNWVDAWIGAVGSSPGSGLVAPPTIPPATNSTPPLGRLSSGELPGAVRRAIAARMGSRFSHPSKYRSRCTKQSPSSATCKVSWSRQRRNYSGVVTIFLRYDKVERLVVANSKSKFRF